MDLADLTLAHFEPLVGEPFVLDKPDGTRCELTLEAADQAGERPGGREPFSLLFRGPPEPLLPQAIYPLAHAALGRLEIFVVPIGRAAAGVTYQAIFT